MSDRTDANATIAALQLFQAAICEHTAALWIGDDAAVSRAREKVARQAEAVLDANETLIIGMKARAP